MALNNASPAQVYSHSRLVPPGAANAKTIALHPSYFSPYFYRGTIDARDVQFLHSLSEGKAKDLVEKKITIMVGRLACFQRTHPDWQQRGPEILSKLVRGDKSGRASQLYVARVTTRGPFLLLNGHRRIAALFGLAARGYIPVHWLREIPVHIYDLAKKECLPKITAGVTLATADVLAEVGMTADSPWAGWMQLQALSKRRPHVDRLQITDVHVNYLTSANSAEGAPLWRSIDAGRVDGSEDQFDTFYERCLDHTQCMTAPVLARGSHHSGFLPRLWMAMEHNPYLLIHEDLLLQRLDVLDHDRLYALLERLIEQNWALCDDHARDVMVDVCFCYSHLGDDVAKWLLMRRLVHNHPEMPLDRYLEHTIPSFQGVSLLLDWWGLRSNLDPELGPRLLNRITQGFNALVHSRINLDESESRQGRIDTRKIASAWRALPLSLLRRLETMLRWEEGPNAVSVLEVNAIVALRWAQEFGVASMLQQYAPGATTQEITHLLKKHRHAAPLTLLAMLRAQHTRVGEQSLLQWMGPELLKTIFTQLQSGAYEGLAVMQRLAAIPTATGNRLTTVGDPARWRSLINGLRNDLFSKIGWLQDIARMNDEKFSNWCAKLAQRAA